MFFNLMNCFIASMLALFSPTILGQFSTPRIINHGNYKQIDAALMSKVHNLYGHVPRDVQNSDQLFPVHANEILNFSMILPWNNEEELNHLLSELSNPQSPKYQQYLDQETFLARFAPTQEQINNLKAHLKSNGINVLSVDPNRLLVQASAAAESVNRVFNTELYYYLDHKGESFYAPAYELQISNSLNIVSVLGLENRIKARPYYKILKNSQPRVNAPTGMTPAKIRSAYSLSTALNGAGQTLALFELDGFNMSDIQGYKNAFNIPDVPVQTILVGGATGTPGDGAGEVVLDIELMLAVAPGASKILVYEGPNSSNGLVSTYNRIATDNLAKNISTSWGLYEQASTGSLLQAENNIFKQMVAQGQVLYAAAGDSGAYDNGANLSVDDPSSQPYVVSVGGTSLYLDGNNNYQSEKTWSSGRGAGNSGGGGGISSVWTIPAWQTPALSAGSLASRTMRNVPDVALDADPSTGYAIFFNNQWQIFGGTSCAAPLWAAFTSLVNQQRVNNGQSVVGFVNPTLYQLGTSAQYNSLFHDINDNSTNGYYPAVNLYDLATGWGSFKGDALISALAGSGTPPPACTQASPTLALSPSSQNGAAGATLSYKLTLTNNDSSACSSSSFKLSALLPSGFSQVLDQDSLTIAPQQSASTTIEISSSPSTLSGTYNFSLNAVNSSNSSYSASASASYIVEDAEAPSLSLSISPQNATFIYNSQEYAYFIVALRDGGRGIANQTLKLTLTGPIVYRTSFNSGRSGMIRYGLFLNRALPVGNYQLNIETNYNGSEVVGQSSFVIKR